MTELSLSSFLFAVFVALLVAALVRMSSPVADSADQTPLTTEEELARQARRKAKSDAKRAKALSKKEALAAGGDVVNKLADTMAETLRGFEAAKKLPSGELPSRQRLADWKDAHWGPKGLPPLYPGPPLWVKDIPGLARVIPASMRPLCTPWLAAPYVNQAQLDEGYLSKRGHSCETCKKLACEPRCICGEAYCSRACQQADWPAHRKCCKTVQDSFEHGLVLTALWWKAQGLDVDAPRF